MRKSLTMAEQQIIDVVFRAVDEVNQTRPADKAVPKALDTRLAGPQGTLDSLGLVNLIVAVEENIEIEFGVNVDLANQRAASAQTNPLDTIATLADYVELLLREERDA